MFGTGSQDPVCRTGTECVWVRVVGRYVFANAYNWIASLYVGVRDTCWLEGDTAWQIDNIDEKPGSFNHWTLACVGVREIIPFWAAVWDNR